MPYTPIHKAEENRTEQTFVEKYEVVGVVASYVDADLDHIAS